MSSPERRGQPGPHLPESESVYPPGVVERWREGAQTWREFREKIPPDELQVADYKDIGCLQAMFLGEKPLTAFNDLAAKHVDALEQAGFQHVGEYVYDPEQLGALIEKHRDAFAEHDVTDVHTLLQKLTSARRGEHFGLRGLALGFPLAAVKSAEESTRMRIGDVVGKLEDLPDFQSDPAKDAMSDVYSGQKRQGADLEAVAKFFEDYLDRHAQELGVERQDLPALSHELRTWLGGKGFNAYGVYWFDLHDSPESQAQHKRLKAAFEQSGILDS